jgi:hypothetical protein
MKRIVQASIILAVAAALLPLAGWAVPPVAATSGVTVSLSVPAGVTPDSNFTAGISISEVADFDACNYDISFDESVLRLDSVTPGLIGSTEIPVDLYNELSPGSYRVIQNVPGLAGADGSGCLAELHFHVIGTAGDSSPVGPSNGVISDITALEIEATWLEGTVLVATEASQAAASPPAANSSPEAMLLPLESTEPAPLLPPSAPSVGSGGIPVLWLVVGGAVLLGIIILFVVARMRAY